ncbi:conserved hypothetical protein [Talaromyces stipitatus ATCC 10500]|uniref:Uncharacterized protein n=1 Tax=Talaromyces stipitatus (strain ATCC 10500 / CBS 375.48 / QM 6759 / NRRL 1006) TaxID=441959 RepID=B8MJH7_TALSN|nr:uncharacterized protein TSTA_046310 [Talaromyces stipitatus ATCC 10500]EED15177.1 conserved hypothetical protein [Talaromyces stipitatus ATCC 10500]
MSDLDTLLAEYTNKENLESSRRDMQSRNDINSKVSKKGLIENLDEPLTDILPEFDGIQILIDPKERSIKTSFAVDGRSVLYNLPLIFQHGNGWWYGCSLDWAGVVISRLRHGTSLEDYFVEYIWKKLGLSAPFPRFNISRYPEYKARTLHGVRRTVVDDGIKLVSCDTWAFDNPEDRDDGSGLSSTTRDFVAVLADLVSSPPRLLKLETLTEMFTPQLFSDGPGVRMLLDLRVAWDNFAGPISAENVNHGLSGLLCTGPVPEIKQPGNMLVWGRATNAIWWANKGLGVAEFLRLSKRRLGMRRLIRC